MRRILAVATLALVLASCEARLEMEVKPNGSGTLGFSFVVEDTYLAALGGFGGGDPFAEMKEELKKGPVPFQVQEFRDESIKARGIRAIVPFDSVQEMEGLVEELQRSGESSPFGEGGFEDFTLERRGDGWHFSARSPAPDLGQLGVPTGELPAIGDLSKVFKFSMRVTLPGGKAQTSADHTEAKGGSTTFIWIPDLKNPKPIDLVANTSGAGSSGSFPVIPVAAVGGGIALAAIIAAILASRRKQPVFAAPGMPGVPPVGDDPPLAEPAPPAPTESGPPPA
ncbi:MAG: hypothetical protein ACRDJM_02890 [Actinomycetota bacterium]